MYTNDLLEALRRLPYVDLGRKNAMMIVPNSSAKAVAVMGDATSVTAFFDAIAPTA